MLPMQKVQSANASHCFSAVHEASYAPFVGNIDVAELRITPVVHGKQGVSMAGADGLIGCSLKGQDRLEKRDGTSVRGKTSHDKKENFGKREKRLIRMSAGRLLFLRTRPEFFLTWEKTHLN